MSGGPQANHVRAAGGVVWRRGEDDRLEVLLVHRPKYDDWSIPKGKADPGESDEDCARREVEEETGLRCEIAEHLGDVAYVDRRGRHKVARYWAMRPVAGEFVPSAEVDEVRWLPIPDAVDLLSYQRDATVLRALAQRVAG
ncbi:MAG: NUDIX hydrolase [Actinobacteria bacterium]|nr:NUDIX hydrolase [Actinomycetota bacterium]